MKSDEPPSRSSLTTTELEAQIRELRGQVRARDEFLSVVGHELRNPVTPLYMQIGMLRDRVAAGAAVEQAWLLEELQRMQSRLDRFLASLNRLLDVSRLGEGAIDLRLEPCDLVDIVTSSLQSFPEVARLSIDVSVRGLTSCSGRWDRLRVEQIVSNLVSNAIRYGLGRPITLTIADDGGDALLHVEDQGTGIATSELDAIFTRFARGGNTRQTAGFGVGLWVVAELARAMGGCVTVASELGKGSVFTVRLPRGPS